VAIFENKDYAQVAGNASAPYLNALMNRAAVLTDSRGITHPSQPNYIALFSGSTHGVIDNRCLTPISAPNLGRQLLDAGYTFVGYAEDLPRPGFTGCADGRYVAKHNPWVAFASVPPEANQPLSAFPRDFATLPTVSFVVPNLCSDMHDCPVSAGDAWARDHLDAYVRWADTHDGVLLVTFDENDGRAGNRILTLFAGAGIKAGRYGEPTDHYRVLRTIEDWYGLAPLGAAAATSPLTGIRG
jgi:acid phosphatase